MRLKAFSIKDKIIFSILFSVLFLVSFTASFFYLTYKASLVKTPEEGKKLESISLEQLEGEVNILLLGYGGAGHEGGTLSDSIIVVNVIPDGKKITFISIPRDLWVEMPIRSDISQNFKINHAYAIGLDDNLYPLKEPQYKGEGGAVTLVKEIVGEVVGMPIDYVVAVDFDGLKKIVDTLGGVEVDVPVTFDDYFYPIKGRENDTCGKSSSEIARLHQEFSDTALHHQFECRYELIHFEKGSTLMDGETALKFTRSRASAQHGGDFARSERQHALLLGIKDKLLSIYSIDKIDELFGQFAAMVQTDLDLATVQKLVAILGVPDAYSVKFVRVSDENVLVSTKSLDGQFILIPKQGEGIWSGVHTFVREQISN